MGLTEALGLVAFLIGTVALMLLVYDRMIQRERAKEIVVEWSPKGLPPAPTWEVLEAYFMPELRAMIEKSGELLTEDFAFTGEEADELALAVLSGLDEEAQLILDTVSVRGRTYGESVLMAMGEQGILTMTITKIMRILWSFNEELPVRDRMDSYLDIAGYALLMLSLSSYVKENSQ